MVFCLRHACSGCLFQPRLVSSPVVSRCLDLAKPISPWGVFSFCEAWSPAFCAPSAVVPGVLVHTTIYRPVATSGCPLHTTPTARVIEGGIWASEQAENTSPTRFTTNREQSSLASHMVVPRLHEAFDLSLHHQDAMRLPGVCMDSKRCCRRAWALQCTTLPQGSFLRLFITNTYEW